ncbi:hypothetical protein CSPAE12_03658 [Colletotrichum incanum]|nr:hypothetical protein CSPAE12_03658 [Colletotrichum incanum]
MIKELPLMRWLSNQPALNCRNKTLDLLKGVAGMKAYSDTLTSYRDRRRNNGPYHEATLLTVLRETPWV